MDERLSIPEIIWGPEYKKALKTWSYDHVIRVLSAFKKHRTMLEKSLDDQEDGDLEFIGKTNQKIHNLMHKEWMYVNLALRIGNKSLDEVTQDIDNASNKQND